VRSKLVEIIREELEGVLREVNPITGVEALMAVSSPLRS